MAKKRWVSYWMIYLLTLMFVLAAAVLPFTPVFLAPVVFIIAQMLAKRAGILIPFRMFDAFVTGILTVAFLVISFVLVGATIASVNFGDLFTVGIVADAALFLLSFIPLPFRTLAKLFAAVGIAVYASLVVAGVSGLFFGVIASVFMLIPKLPVVGRFIPQTLIGLTGLRLLVEVLV